MGLVSSTELRAERQWVALEAAERNWREMSIESNYYIQPDTEGRQAPNWTPLSNAGKPREVVFSAQLHTNLIQMRETLT